MLVEEQRGDSDGKIGRAVEWLRARLAGQGEVPVSVLRGDAEREGLNSWTVKEAKDKLGVRRGRTDIREGGTGPKCRRGGPRRRQSQILPSAGASPLRRGDVQAAKPQEHIYKLKGGRKVCATPLPPLATDTPAILSRARVLLWRLRGTPGNRIDPGAAAAVTSGRHGAAGRRLAAGIMETVGADASGPAIDVAIMQALTHGTQ